MLRTGKKNEAEWPTMDKNQTHCKKKKKKKDKI